MSSALGRDVVIVLALVACMFATQTMLVTVLALAGARFGLAGVEIGAVVAIPAFLGLLCSVPVAVVSDALGRRSLLMVAGAIGAAGGGSFMLLSGAPGLVVAALGLGLYLALSTGSALAFVTEVGSPADQPRIQGRNGAAQALAALAGALGAGLLLDLGGPDAAFGGMAALALGVSVLAAVSRERPRARRMLTSTALVTSYRRGLGMLASRWQVRTAAAVTLNTIHLVVVANAFGALFIVHQLGGSATVAGIAIALRSVVAGAVSTLFPRSSSRYGLLAPMVVTGAIGGVAVLILPLAQALPIAAILIGLQGIGTGLGAATANTFITAGTERSERALGFAIHVVPARIVSLLLPVLLGLVLQTMGIAAVFVVAAGATATFVAAIALLGYRGARAEATRPR